MNSKNDLEEVKTARVTKEQKELLRFIVEFLERYGFQPSRREMADYFGININAVNVRLASLAKHEVITLTGKDRAILIPNLSFKREHVGMEEATQKMKEIEEMSQEPKTKP